MQSDKGSTWAKNIGEMAEEAFKLILEADTPENFKNWFLDLFQVCQAIVLWIFDGVQKSAEAIKFLLMDFESDLQLIFTVCNLKYSFCDKIVVFYQI